MVLWFLTIAALGIYQIVLHPEFSSQHSARFLFQKLPPTIMDMITPRFVSFLKRAFSTSIIMGGRVSFLWGERELG